MTPIPWPPGSTASARSDAVVVVSAVGAPQPEATSYATPTVPCPPPPASSSTRAGTAHWLLLEQVWSAEQSASTLHATQVPSAVPPGVPHTLPPPHEPAMGAVPHPPSVQVAS